MDFGSQVSLNSSTQENEPYTNRETGTMDKFGLVRTISKTTNISGQSGDFVSMTNLETRTGEKRNTGLSNAPAVPEVDNEKTSRQRIKAQVSTSTKLPGIDRVTPPHVTPLVDNGASLEEALNNIVSSIREQLKEKEKNRNRQQVGRSEKCLKGRTDEHISKSLSRMTREAEQRE